MAWLNGRTRAEGEARAKGRGLGWAAAGWARAVAEGRCLGAGARLGLVLNGRTRTDSEIGTKGLGRANTKGGTEGWIRTKGWRQGAEPGPRARFG